VGRAGDRGEAARRVCREPSGRGRGRNSDRPRSTSAGSYSLGLQQRAACDIGCMLVVRSSNPVNSEKSFCSCNKNRRFHSPRPRNWKGGRAPHRSVGSDAEQRRRAVACRHLLWIARGDQIGLGGADSRRFALPVSLRRVRCVCVLNSRGGVMAEGSEARSVASACRGRRLGTKRRGLGVDWWRFERIGRWPTRA
jgi:hypothetical protein